MTSYDFGAFDALVVALWGKWASREWTPANKELVLSMLRPYPADACVEELRKQRFQKPDDAKPLWSLLRSDLKARFYRVEQSEEEAELDRKAIRDTAALRTWMREHTPDEIKAAFGEAVEAVPVLHGSVLNASRFLPRTTLEAFVARAWSQGERFEDLTYQGDRE